MNHRRGMLVCLALMVFCLGGTSFAQMPGMGNGSGAFNGYEGHNMNNDLILPQVVVGQCYAAR